MKILKFAKNCRRVNIPFLLTDYSPWQDQIKDKIQEIRDTYKFSKKAEINFSIHNGYAEIYLTK